MTIHTKPVHLPTIDFSRFYGSADERAAFIKELTRVLHDHGFFYGIFSVLLALLTGWAGRFLFRKE